MPPSTPPLSDESSYRGSELSLIGGFPLDSVAKSEFPLLHMQDSLAKSGLFSFIAFAVSSLAKQWISFITYADRIPWRKSGFLHTNQVRSQCLPPY